MGWSGAFWVAESVLGLDFGVALEDEDCAHKGKAGAKAKAASTIATKRRSLRDFGFSGTRQEKADSSLRSE
jgi:hypothetical protein